MFSPYSSSQMPLLGIAALTPIHIHSRNEHPFPPFLFNLWGNRETSLLNTIKTEANIHRVSHQGSISISSLLQHKCNKIMRSVKLSRRNISLWSGKVKVEKILLLCSQMYKIPCDKLYKKNTQTTEGARHFYYLVWRKLLYDEEEQRSWELPLPFWWPSFKTSKL